MTDISKLTETEVKALGFDEMRKINTAQENLRLINLRLAEIEKERKKK